MFNPVLQIIFENYFLQKFAVSYSPQILAV